MKKLFLALVLIGLVSSLFSLEYVETQDNGALVYCTYDVTEIEKALGITLEEYRVEAKRHYDTEVVNTTYLMLVYPDNDWQVVVITKDFFYIFISIKNEE